MSFHVVSLLYRAHDSDQPCFSARADPAAFSGALHAAAVPAAEPSAAQRAPRNDAEPFVAAHREDLELGCPAHQVVLGLQADERLPVVRAGNIERLLELPAAEVAGPDVPHPSAGHQLVQGAQGFFKRGDGVPRVDLVEIDVVGPQALEAVLHGGVDVLAAQADVIGPVRPWQSGPSWR